MYLAGDPREHHQRVARHGHVDALQVVGPRVAHDDVGRLRHERLRAGPDVSRDDAQVRQPDS